MTSSAAQEQVRETWERFDSFRDSVSALVAAGPTSVREWFPNRVSEAEFLKLGADDSQAASVILWLWNNLDMVEEGAELVDALDEVIADRAPELSAGFVELRSELTRLLTETEDDRSERAVERLQHVIVPNLMLADTAVDLRVDRRALRTSDQLALAPVVLMRLTFDEPVGGGSALAFQLSRNSLQQLRT